MKNNLILSLSCVLALTTAAASLAMPGKGGAATATEASSQTAPEPVAGKVLQTMDSGGYTYAYIQKSNGDKIWVACMATTITVGSQVSYKGGMEMVNFESKSLKRTFDKIIFADSVVSDTPAKTADGKSKEKSTSGGSKAAVSDKDAKISVAKATGANAHTVQDVFANSSKLNKKKVVVRGKVVKVSVGIMGKNWIHIQDGTGSQSKKTHNLVCTSQEMADVDDIVVISGTLAKDKDFGGGYKYSAIVEESTIKKEK